MNNADHRWQDCPCDECESLRGRYATINGKLARMVERLEHALAHGDCEHDWHKGGTRNGIVVYDCQSCGATSMEIV